MKRTRTIFSRIFIFNLVVVVLGVSLLSALEYALISKYIYREKLSSLESNARSIISYIDGSNSFEQLENFLYGFSKSANRSILIIDSNCKVVMASADKSIYNKNTVYVGKEYCSEVLKNNSHTLRGTLGGVYKTEMFTLQIPVISGESDLVIGAIFISAPAPEMQEMQGKIFKILALSILCVSAITLIFSFLLSRRLSKPIKKIGKVARQFANGDFSCRVETDKNGDNITEITELATAFNDMADDIMRADNVRNNFISDVSHELRTPMTTIAGFVDGILDETIPPEKQKDYLIIVKDEISRLSALVNSFLNMTRMKNGDITLEMTNFDINEMIRLTLISFENRIEEKNIDVEVEFEEESIYAYADSDSIKRVITNLLDNAIKFTEQNGTISLKVYRQGQELFVAIRNTGCGISPNDQKMIFERFYKADKSRSINKQGTGIGLFIVKDIINRHHKEIRVVSREGEFAEFIFNLDLGKKP